MHEAHERRGLTCERPGGRWRVSATCLSLAASEATAERWQSFAAEAQVAGVDSACQQSRHALVALLQFAGQVLDGGDRFGTSPSNQEAGGFIL